MTAGSSDLLDRLDLKEYEKTTLEHLFSAGRTSAPDIARATDVPKARVYDVLDGLADRGFVEVIPGRPKQYQAKPPNAVLERSKENQRQAYESFCDSIDELSESFLETYQPLYEQADEDVSAAADLFHVVDVGDPSESETRRLYEDAEREVHVITNSFAYFDEIERSLERALDRGVDVSVLFLTPELLPEAKREVQADIVDRLHEEYPAVGTRFSEGQLPWRGTFVDPSMDYTSGEAIMLVEEPDVPDHKRQAAITENGSFVAGMKRYFDLIWAHESHETYPGS
jgi:sugar-specific transcriptional regulator TrmB